MFFLVGVMIVYSTWIILFTTTTLNDHYTIQVLVSGWVFLVGASVSMAWVTSKCRCVGGWVGVCVAECVGGRVCVCGVLSVWVGRVGGRVGRVEFPTPN